MYDTEEAQIFAWELLRVKGYVTLIIVGVLNEEGVIRRWHTRLHVDTRREKERVEGQAGRMERRKFVVGEGKRSGAGRQLKC